MCGTIFLIPMMTPQPEVAAAPAGFPGAPQQTMAPAPAPEPEPEPPPEPEVPRVVRIPCPNGHVLETPSDMFGQQALCPYCNVQFELRYDDSLEAKEALEEAKRRNEEQFNQNLLKWSIRIAVGVGLSIVIMILWSLLKPS
jgi:hypothetical protein